MATKLYLMRHGQTRFNQQGRIQGACDSPLTDLGKEQALAAHQYFQNRGLSSIKCILQHKNVPVTHPNWTDYVGLKGLKEQDF